MYIIIITLQNYINNLNERSYRLFDALLFEYWQYWADVLKVKFCVMLVFFVRNWNQENKRKGDEREIKRKRDENISYNLTQPAFTCSKLTIETLEQGVGYAQS